METSSKYYKHEIEIMGMIFASITPVEWIFYSLIRPNMNNDNKIRFNINLFVLGIYMVPISMLTESLIIFIILIFKPPLHDTEIQLFLVYKSGTEA